MSYRTFLSNESLISLIGNKLICNFVMRIDIFLKVLSYISLKDTDNGSCIIMFFLNRNALSTKMFLRGNCTANQHSACFVHYLKSISTIISKPRLLNLILLNLIVRLPTERSHYTNNLWNATFGLWKIRIMNGWMVSFEWKTSKHHKNKELVATLWFYYESFRRLLFFSVCKYFENIVKIILWKNLHTRIHN